MRIVITYQHRDNEQYLKLIELAFASAQRLGYETVLVGSGVPYEMANYHIGFPAEKEPHLMNWVLAAQRAFIESPLFDCDSVIFSPDALITRPLEPVFDKRFDVAFTVRDNKRWPINNGVIFLKPRKKEKISLLWHAAQFICRSYPIETQDWYGDQQSLHDIWVTGVHLRLGVDVKMLSCDLYNASPRYGEEDAAKLIESAYIVHMKGQRKNLMQEYWDLICKE